LEKVLKKTVDFSKKNSLYGIVKNGINYSFNGTNSTFFNHAMGPTSDVMIRIAIPKRLVCTRSQLQSLEANPKAH